jgi:hypothetical protein
LPMFGRHAKVRRDSCANQQTSSSGFLCLSSCPPRCALQSLETRKSHHRHGQCRPSAYEAAAVMRAAKCALAIAAQGKSRQRPSHRRPSAYFAHHPASGPQTALKPLCHKEK